MTTALQHTVLAKNLSAETENKIHSDDVAKQFGFESALVGGVNVYAYMTHVPVLHFGSNWLARGSAECRFHKPVYDGRSANCSGEIIDDGSLSLKAEMDDVCCATGRANLETEKPAPEIDLIPVAPFPPPEARPRGNPENLAAGTVMGTYESSVSALELQEYCDDVREDLTFYNDEGIVHPGMILQMANRSLAGNVFISPWIHVGSVIQNHAVPRIDKMLSARGKVLNEYEHKGHKFVELDVLIVSDNSECIARIHHTAIYQPRHATD